MIGLHATSDSPPAIFRWTRDGETRYGTLYTPGGQVFARDVTLDQASEELLGQHAVIHRSE